MDMVTSHCLYIELVGLLTTQEILVINILR